MAQIRPLNLDTNATFHFLEVGMGVGAFSREILGAFPHATGHGFDLVPRAIEIASVVLPQARMKVTVGDMVDIHEPSESFDLVFVPGALCYLSSLHPPRLCRLAVFPIKPTFLSLSQEIALGCRWWIAPAHLPKTDGIPPEGVLQAP